MASELSNIKDEDLLRKLWQETEDFGRKKEIRAHMYKLREARLREFYVNEMDSKNQQSFDAKTPITSRHGAMADQHNFETLKSNEIRGTDMGDIQFSDAGGWNVISHTEFSDDGKARTDKMLATTEGVQALKGGQKTFAGKNEELKSERFDGDANNFTYTTGESSNMELNENIVTGDDTNKRVEKKSSSVSHSSKVIRSSNNSADVSSSNYDECTNNNQQSRYDQDSRRSSTNTVKSTSQNVSNEQNAKLSQESPHVQEAFRLAQQPGTVLSRKVERANDNTNMITERKELHDGTIVTTKRYEPISSDHVDIQATSTTNRNQTTSSSNNTKHETVNKSQNVETTNQTFKTARDEEAFRLSQQPGKVISRDVTMSDDNTKVITEKKELHDGTIVTTKRFEKVGSDNTTNKARNEEQKFSSTTTNQTFKTARDEEAFRLSQQPGKVISRDVTMSDDTTRMITEKKELHDGTIVTTKRFENIGSDKSTDKEQKFSSTTTNQTFKTTRDEEAHRLSQQPGRVISRDVTMSDDTTKVITEKKELNDGTIVTTKRFEKVGSDKTTDKTRNEEQKFSSTTTNQTFKTPRDEEAYRLSQQPGKVISRDVTMSDDKTRMITEKKELHDGTIVTTKRFEKVDNAADKEKKFSSTTNTTTTTTNKTSNTSRDDEAFRLSQQPGKIISRDVTMTNPTTKMIVEKKELNDGTVVTTKRFESVDSSSDTKSVKSFTKEQQNVDEFAKSLRNDSQQTTKTETNFRTPRDEEAFRMAQQPGKVLSRDVSMANPTTRMIVEKKELHDGTIVTTKRYENINENVEKIQPKNVKNVESVKKTTNVNDDKTTQREIVEETVTKKIFDTSCHCPSLTDKHDHKNREFIQNERNNDKYDVTTEIITTNDTQNNKKVFTEVEKNRDDLIRREEMRKLEQKRVDEQTIRQQQPQERKITRDLEVDSAHKAFASSLRCKTPPLEKHSTPRNHDRRSPSRETTSSKFSSSTMTIKRNSNDFMKPTQSFDRKTTKSPEKAQSPSKKIHKTSTTEVIENIDDTQQKVKTQKITVDSRKPTKEFEKPQKPASSTLPRDSSPKKHSTSTLPRETSPTKSSPSTPRSVSPQKPSNLTSTPRDSSPQKPTTPASYPRDSSPQKPTTPAYYPRDSSPQKPTTPYSYPRDSSPQKPANLPRESSPHKPTSSSTLPRDSSPQKPVNLTSISRDSSPQKPTNSYSQPRDSSPQKPVSLTNLSRDSSPENRTSTPRSVSPQKSANSTTIPRDSSPQKPRYSHPRDSSPHSGTSTPRDTSPSKSSPRSVTPQKSTHSSQPRDSSPQKPVSLTSISRDSSPQKPVNSYSQPRDSSPQKPVNLTNLSRDSSPQKPTNSYSQPRDSSPQKPVNLSSLSRDTSPQKPSTTPREQSPEKVNPSTPRSASPLKPINYPNPRDSSPQKPVNLSSLSRDSSPQKQHPTASATYPRSHKPTDSPRSTSPEKNSTLPRDSKKPRESSSRDESPSKSTKHDVTTDDEDDDTNDDILTTTIKIDNIDKTINDLKIIQTIDSKNMSATTSVSDLEYISASDHRKMITDLDCEDIEMKIKIENVNELDDLEIKTTVSEVVDGKNKKSPQKPLTRNRSETFEERAKKLIGVKSDDDELKDIPSYLRPTKASSASAPVKSTPSRVSEIRERKAKIEELEKVSSTTTTTTSTKKNSITNVTNEFIHNEKTVDKSPICKKPSESKKPHDNRSSDIEDTKDTKKTTITNNRTTSKSPEKKKPDERITKTTKVTENIMTTSDERTSRTRQKTPETHITVAQITISPSRGITSKTVTKTSTVQSNKTLKVAPHIHLIKQPTDISSTEPDSDHETDHELIKNIDKVGSKSTRKKLIQNRKDSAPVTKTTTTTSTSDKEKVSRSVSEKIIKVDKKGATITRDFKDSPKKDSKRPQKCITTKTINLTNVNGTATLHSNNLDNVEIDINVEHAKSSREPSPNKVTAIPVHTDDDDEVNEEKFLRPNKVTEPEDDVRRSKPKVINVPIFQEETKQFVGLEITEVGTEKSHTILEEEEIDEHERIINSSTLEKADRKRNSVQIDALDEDGEDDVEHAHLLSVSQKVNKFNETVEELKKQKTTKTRKDDDFKLEDVLDDIDDSEDEDDEDDVRMSVTQKVSKFSKIKDDTATTVKQRTEDFMTRSVDEVDETLINDECLLSVSDKVNKFISSAEKIGSTAPQKSPELVKNIMKQTSKNVKEKIDNITEAFLTNEKISSDTKSTNIKTSDITLKSTEAIKKAREVFENNTATRDINRHNDILSRPSVFEGNSNKPRTPTVERKTYKETVTSTTNRRSSSSSHDKSPDRHSPTKDHPDVKSTSRRGSNDRTPVYMKDQVSTKKDLFEKRISSSKLESENYHHKSLSPQNSIDEKRHSITDDSHHHHTRKTSNSDKHYMQHTVASLEHVVTTNVREAELHRTSHLDYNDSSRRSSLRTPTKMPSEPREEFIESPRTPTKFGVELKRTDSYKSQTRKVSTGCETINIEEIFDLEELERLLEIVVGYEQRRRIRAQIRIVKKKIEDKRLNSEIKSSRMTTTRTTTSRTEPVMQAKIIERKTVEKSKTLPRDQTVTTTTTTTRVSSSTSDKEPKVTRTTKVTTTPASPRTIIESLNKNTKGKATESVVKTVKKTSATSNTAQQRSSTMRESKTETDCITSSYGVGPTDSNGLPLFGLKALKKKSPAVVESKTTGTIVSEVSYSENGKPAVVQRKTTKYSSDPSDFSHETDVNVKSSKSVTERKGSRGGIYSVTKTEKIESDKKPRVIRNGSVKELKEKFVRKDSSSRMSERSVKSESKRTSIDSCCNSKSCKNETKSFLNSERKATNVKEVMTMMKNADDVYEEGDTMEDVEARALLNKFFGATALMTSIEKNSGLTKEFLSSGAKNKSASSASKVTKTVTSYKSGKSQDINDIWDVDLLKKLLEATTNYEERRKIRERIRQVMADKEACADIVKQLSAELDADQTTSAETSSSIVKTNQEGESLLLLPLLTGILQNPKYRNLSARQILTLNLSRAIAHQSMDNTQNSPTSATKMNSEHNNELNDNDKNDCLGNDFPIVDSGTESGEDLRLLAALNNHIDEQPQNTLDVKQKMDELGTDLLAEVTTALERLQNSLNQGEINLDDSKKSALLSLVNKLQLGLISPDKKNESNSPEVATVNGQTPLEKLMESNDIRRGSGGNINRFNKRKNREKRHTVGVTREELADARRIIEEIEYIGLKNANPVTQSKVTAKMSLVDSTPGVYNAILTRQISEPITLLRPSQFVPKETQGKPKYKLLFKQSISLDQPSSILKNTVKQEVIPKPTDTVQRNSSDLSSNNSSTKFIGNNKIEDDVQSDDESSSSDDEEEMVNTKYYNNNANTPNGKFKAKENFLRNQQINEKALNYSSGDEGNNSSSGMRQQKYASKKMKMKRANTVDLPKSFSFLNTFNLSDRDYSDNETLQNTYHNRSTGLKTTFISGVPAPIEPPKFTPKTENDKKFLAFIQKQNTNVIPTYVNPTAKIESKQANWTNKFGNLKTKFEDSPNLPPKVVPKTSNAAANFWKNIEKDKPSAKVSPLPAVPIKTAQPFVKSLPTSTEKFPWKSTVGEKIFSKSLEEAAPKKMQMIEKFEPKEQIEVKVFKSIPEPNKLPVLKPSNVNNFSHAPMSAFKPPISRKLSNSFKPIANEEVLKKPMPQITNGVVKQMAETGYSINNAIPQPRKVTSSPTRSLANLESTFVKIQKSVEPKSEPTPWSSQPKSERVLSLAATKFENVPTVHLASHLQESQDPPIVRFRHNPLYSGTVEKRSSLPPNATYASFDPVYKNPKKEISPPKTNSKETTFVITDYTAPTSISTYAPPPQPSENHLIPSVRPTLDRQDSLTNPSKEPLVLTCDRTVISPRENLPIEAPHFPAVSPQISNANSVSLGSICDDLEHELDDLGESIECQVAVSKVMKAPIAQTAFTQSSELTSLNGQSKENSMMKSLQDSLKKVQQKSPTPEKRQSEKRLSQDSSNSSIDLKLQALKMPAVKFETTDSQSRLSQDSSSSSIDIKLPPLKIPIPAVPETAYSITYQSPPRIQVKSPSSDPPPHVLYNNTSSKVRQTHSSLPLPKPTAVVDRSISPPGMYGVSQNVIDAKQKTVASFFTTPQRTESLKMKPKPLSFAPSSQSSMRKISLQVKPMMSQTRANRTQSMSALSRSKTMPSLANVELLDESNIDDAFEELLSSANL